MESVQAACFFLLAVLPLLVCGGESPISPDGSVSFGPSSGATTKREHSGGIWAEEHPGFAIQSGYEGYLVPVEENLSIKDIIKTAGFLAALPVLGKLVLKFVVKTAIAALGAVAVVSVGVLLTIALCTFTSVCSVTFHKLGDKWHHWDRASVRSLVTQDSINTAADFLTTAIAKYNTVNSEKAAR